MNALLMVTWLVQGLLLITGGVLLLAAPESMAALLPDVVQAATSQGIRREIIQLVSPLAIGLGLVSLGATQQRFAWQRQNLAAISTASWLMGLAANLWAYGLGDAPMFPALMAAMAGLNAIHLTRRSPGPTPESVRPAASDIAPQLSDLWWVQCVFYAVVGGAMALQPEEVLGVLFAGGQVADPETLTTARVGASILLSMAMLSGSAAGTQTPATLRGMGALFVVTQLGFALSIPLQHQGDTERMWLAVLVLPAVGFAFATLRVLVDFESLQRFIQWFRDTLNGWWLLQIGTFVGGALLWWFAPDTVMKALSHTDLSGLDVYEQYQLGVDVVRLIGPIALGMAALTVIGMMHGSFASRRKMSQLFLLWLCTWLFIFFYNETGHFGRHESRFSALAAGLATPAAALLFVNWMTSVRNDGVTPESLYGGTADTKPKWLWTFWILQGLLLMGVGFVLWFAPEQLAYAVLHHDVALRTTLATVEIDQVRMSAPYWLTTGAVSLHAAWTVHEWEWRRLARWFFAWELAWSVSLLYGFDVTFYTRWLIGAALLLTAFAGLNLAATGTQRRSYDVDRAERPTGWEAMDLVAGLAMIVQTLTTRRRASHLVGVGLRGDFKVTVPSVQEDPDFPHNDFFHKHRGETLKLTARFANLSWLDDAAMDIRGGSIRLHEPDTQAPAFDMVMNTGSFTAPENILDFAEAVLSKWLPLSVVAKALTKDHVAREGALAGFRRAPDSYAELRFYSQIVRNWFGTVASEGPPNPLPSAELPKLLRQTLIQERGDRLLGPKDAWLVRYRLTPRALIKPEVLARLDMGEIKPEQLQESDFNPESGLPDAVDTFTPWDRERRADFNGSTNYLREEMAQRVANEGAVFYFQAQFFRERPAGEQQGTALSWYNASVDWDTDRAPWRDIGTVSLRRPLAAPRTERLRFNPNTSPLSMGIPVATSLKDYRSLGDAEGRVMWVLQRVRFWVYKVRGRVLRIKEGRR